MFVSEQMAISAAEDFANKYHFRFSNLLNGEVVKEKEPNQKAIEHVLTLRDEEEDAALYLINYENEGFVVVPANQQLNPILAYSETSKMPVSKDEPIPGGLDIWLKEHISAVNHLSSTKKKGEVVKHRGWIALLSSSSPASGKAKPIEPPSGGSCEDELTEVGPLLQTTWGQEDGYNNALEDRGCDTTINGRVLTGCVATAIAQVMRYHEHPATYNWDVMPDGIADPWNQPAGTAEMATLMLDVGNAVDMLWGCAFSGAVTANGVPALENTFNYSSTADYHGYDSNEIVYEINQSRPVILRGVDSDAGGHAWVADGYRKHRTWSDDCSYGWTYLHFHMNWGWNGAHNAWYSFDNFSPDGDNYSNSNYQIVGIEP